MPGLAFFALALISTTERRAFPIQLEHVLRRAAVPVAAQTHSASEPTPSPKRRVGRLKGRPNRNKTAVDLSPELQRIQTMVQVLLRLSHGLLSLGYLVLDGHFGHNAALQMSRQCGCT